MSDDANCEHCGKHGRRRRGTMAPEGWLYLETLDVDGDERGVMVTWACGPNCALALWCKGPGKLPFGSEKEKDASAVSAFPPSVRDRMLDLLKAEGCT
jgi:hypothetical protein